jgi:hypothetical protein
MDARRAVGKIHHRRFGLLASWSARRISRSHTSVGFGGPSDPLHPKAERAHKRMDMLSNPFRGCRAYEKLTYVAFEME